MFGCATTTDYGRIGDIKEAYLIKNEYLVVCVDGVILGAEGEYYVELPLNGTFLHPKYAVRYFEPVSYDVAIPQFRFPQSLMKKGCAAGDLTEDRVPVPVVRDLFIPKPSIVGDRDGTYSYSQKEQNQASANAAANSYINALRAVDKKAGTVYVVRKSDGRSSPNFIYASERTLYGSYKTVSFVPPSREVTYVPDDILLRVVLVPVVVGIVGPYMLGDAIGGAIKSGRGGSGSTAQSAEKPKKSTQSADPGLSASEAALDPLLDGQWRTIDEITRYRRNGTHFIVKGTVCALEIARDRMSSDCSHELGSISHQVSTYRLLGSGKYEFQIIEANNSSVDLVGLRGTADYRLEEDKLIVTTYLEESIYVNKTTAIYVRDRPRLSP